MNALKKQELYQLVKDFDTAARPAGDDPTAPATVEDLDNLVTQTAHALDQIIAYICQN